MKTVSFTIGIDIGSEECVAATYVVGRSKCPTIRFANTDEGFEALCAWLTPSSISPPTIASWYGSHWCLW
jgi:molecular chaperone DnaK (HSP70)